MNQDGRQTQGSADDKGGATPGRWTQIAPVPSHKLPGFEHTHVEEDECRGDDQRADRSPIGQ